MTIGFYFSDGFIKEDAGCQDNHLRQQLIEVNGFVFLAHAVQDRGCPLSEPDEGQSSCANRLPYEVQIDGCIVQAQLYIAEIPELFRVLHWVQLIKVTLAVLCPSIIAQPNVIASFDEQGWERLILSLKPRETVH